MRPQWVVSAGWPTSGPTFTETVWGGSWTLLLREACGMNDLEAAAYEICEQVRDGRWEAALDGAPNKQPAACAEIIETLRRRCPGHGTDEYQAAIARGMTSTR